MPRHGTGYAIKVGRPTAAGFEFVRGLVQRGVAGSAGVHTRVGVLLIEFMGERLFGSLFAEDAELFW